MYANILCSLEPCCGIITACIPILQPALAKIFGANPLEWTRHSTTLTPIAVPSAKTSTTLWSPRWPTKMTIPSAKTSTTLWSPKWPPIVNVAGETSLQWPSGQRPKSPAINIAWPESNERRTVRFKDVDWSDYFAPRVENIPMSTYHIPGTRRHDRAISHEVNDPQAGDEAVSPCSNNVLRPWKKEDDHKTSASAQGWD